MSKFSPGRPELPDHDRKKARIAVRLKDRDFEMVERAAAAAGYKNLSRYVRACVLAQSHEVLRCAGEDPDRQTSLFDGEV